eukprot:709591-Pelagomonas_calceolata.AAC.1
MAMPSASGLYWYLFMPFTMNLKLFSALKGKQPLGIESKPSASEIPFYRANLGCFQRIGCMWLPIFKIESYFHHDCVLLCYYDTIVAVAGSSSMPGSESLAEGWAYTGRTLMGSVISKMANTKLVQGFTTISLTAKNILDSTIVMTRVCCAENVLQPDTVLELSTPYVELNLQQLLLPSGQVQTDETYCFISKLMCGCRKPGRMADNPLDDLHYFAPSCASGTTGGTY